jgi:hypothetical protein
MKDDQAHGLPYALFKTEIGGGLNNMIMNVAQLTSDTCMRGERPKEVLVLPRFTTGKNFFKKRGEKYNNESMPFGELFDAHHFMRQMRPCRFAESVPEGARWRYVNVVGISKTWNYGHMLPRVYNALRAGPTVAPILARSLRRVEEGAGLHWSAVHLRIESDWMFLAQFCVLQRYTPRRCFTPTEVAQITQDARARAKSTGTLLLYATDLVSPAGPVVKPRAYREPTVKLPKLANASYTVRAAVEMFMAAQAPAGFYGNAYSTFSRGVSLLRSGDSCATGSLGTPSTARSCGSYTYDCGGKYEKADFLPVGFAVLDEQSCEDASALRVRGHVASLENRSAGALSMFRDVWNPIARSVGVPKGTGAMPAMKQQKQQQRQQQRQQRQQRQQQQQQQQQQPQQQPQPQPQQQQQLELPS